MQLLVRGSVQLDMVRAILPEFQFSFHPREGGYLSCIEIFQSIFRAGFEGLEFTHRLGSYTKSVIKKISRKPTSKCSCYRTNSGIATVSNYYANRGNVITANRYVLLNGNRSALTTTLRRFPVQNFLRQHSTDAGNTHARTHVRTHIHQNCRSPVSPTFPESNGQAQIQL